METSKVQTLHVIPVNAEIPLAVTLHSFYLCQNHLHEKTLKKGNFLNHDWGYIQQSLLACPTEVAHLSSHEELYERSIPSIQNPNILVLLVF